MPNTQLKLSANTLVNASATYFSVPPLSGSLWTEYYQSFTIDYAYINFYNTNTSFAASSLSALPVISENACVVNVSVNTNQIVTSGIAASSLVVLNEFWVEKDDTLRTDSPGPNGKVRTLVTGFIRRPTIGTDSNKSSTFQKTFNLYIRPGAFNQANSTETINQLVFESLSLLDDFILVSLLKV